MGAGRMRRKSSQFYLDSTVGVSYLAAGHNLSRLVVKKLAVDQLQSAQLHLRPNNNLLPAGHLMGGICALCDLTVLFY